MNKFRIKGKLLRGFVFVLSKQIPVLYQKHQAKKHLRISAGLFLHLHTLRKAQEAREARLLQGTSSNSYFASDETEAHKGETS